MPQPLAICVEDLLATSDAARYLRCVALPGRQPGLRLGRGGDVLWCSDDAADHELWVSADGQLILLRRAGAGPATVTREGRSLAVPEEKPVVLLDLDEIEVAGRRLRVHVHGETTSVAAPSPLAGAAPSSRRGLLARAAAAVLAIGAAAGSTACKKRIEVRDQPPAVSTEPPPKPKKVEVRDSPPAAPILKDEPVAKPKVDDRPPKK